MKIDNIITTCNRRYIRAHRRYNAGDKSSWAKAQWYFKHSQLREQLHIHCQG